MNSLQNKKFHALSQFERQLCAVQGKMFELSARKNFASREFIDFYMKSKTAQFFDLPYDRTQWLGEEIVKPCDAQTMNALYPAYHTLACEMAIERIFEGNSID